MTAFAMARYMQGLSRLSLKTIVTALRQTPSIPGANELLGHQHCALGYGTNEIDRASDTPGPPSSALKLSNSRLASQPNDTFFL